MASFAICWALYGKTIKFPFAFDDVVYLVNSPLFHEHYRYDYFRDFSDFANSGKRNGFDSEFVVNFISRPVSYLTFHASKWIGGMEPAAFRLPNIIIHWLNSLLVFGLVSFLARSKPHPQQPEGPPAASRWFIPGLAALLFLVHPLQTESVTYIAQRFESLATLWFLAALFAFIVGVSTCKRWQRIVWQSISVIALVMGMLSKEIVFTAPFIMVACAWLVMGVPLKTSFRRALPQLLCLPLTPALLLGASWAQNDNTLNLWKAVNITNIGAEHYHVLHYGLTQACAAITYLRLFLLPMGQNLDPDYRLTTSLADDRLLLSLAAISLLLYACGHCFRHRGDDRRFALVGFGLLWYFITLMPSSSFIPLPDLLAEHRSYLPLIGIMMASAAALDLLRTKSTLLARGVPAAAAIWLFSLAFATVARNEVWRTSLALWEDTAKKSPEKARVLHNLAVCYAQEGKHEMALRYFRETIRLNPGYGSAYVNMAITLNTLERYNEALEIAEFGLQAKPDVADLHHQAGYALAGLGRHVAAAEHLRKAIAAAPNHVLANIMLGNLLRMTRQNEEALTHYKRAAAFDRSNAELKLAINEMEEQRNRTR